MPTSKTFIVPAEYAEAFRESAVEELEYAASGLQDLLSHKDKPKWEVTEAEIDVARCRLRYAEALYDDVRDPQEGSLVVDVTDSSLGCLPFLVERAAESLGDVATEIFDAETQAKLRTRFETLTFWVGLFESFGAQYIAETERSRRAYEARQAAR